MSEVRMVDPETGGAKGSKPERLDLIPIEPLLELSKHYGIGAFKYEDDNWRRGYDWKYSYAALQRHANEWWTGQEWGWETFVNRETGEEVTVLVNHMIAVAWHAFALYWFSIHMRSKSPDRFMAEGPAEQWRELAYVLRNPRTLSEATD